MCAYADATLDNKTIKVTRFHLMVNFLLSLDIIIALKVFQTFSHNKFLPFSKIRSIKYLRSFIMMIYFRCQTPNNISCNLSNNFTFLLMKKSDNSSWKILFHPSPCHKNDENDEIGFNTNKPVQSKIAATHKNLLQLQLLKWEGSLAPWISTLSLSIKFLL